MMKPKRSGSITSAETSNYTPEALSRQCTKTLQKSLGRKPAGKELLCGMRSTKRKREEKNGRIIRTGS